MPLIRAQTSDGKEIVSVLLQILRGTSFGKRTPTIDHRIAAARELLQRGWGRVLEADSTDVGTVTILVKDPRDLPVRSEQ